MRLWLSKGAGGQNKLRDEAMVHSGIRLEACLLGKQLIWRGWLIKAGGFVEGMEVGGGHTLPWEGTEEKPYSIVFITMRLREGWVLKRG